MEIPEISNWPTIEQRLADIIKKQNLIIGDTQRDIYLYLEGAKALQPTEVTCPYCDKKITTLELGLNPFPNITDWEDFDRSEPNSMTFGEIMKYNQHDLLTELLTLIQTIEIKDRQLDIDIKRLGRNVKILKRIAQIIQDTPATIKTCNSDPVQMNVCLIEIIEDIRKTLLMEL